MQSCNKNIVPHCLEQQLISILLALFLALGLTGVVWGDSNIYSDTYSSTYGLRDEPAMFSATGRLSDIQSLRVDVMLYGKRQTLAGQQALGFLILRSYVVYDDTTTSGFRTTDKFKHWKSGGSAYLPAPYPWTGKIPWLGKIWRVTSTWTTRPGTTATWSFTVSMPRGKCVVTTGGQQFDCKMEGKYLLKWTDNSKSNRTVDLEFWLTLNDDIKGKFKVKYPGSNRPDDEGTYARAK